MKISILITFILFVNSIFSQIGLLDKNPIPDLKNGTTYVVMNDTGASIANEYKQIFKKYWTISKLKFIKESDIKNYYAPGNFFFSLDLIDKLVGQFTYSNYYFNLWTCDPKFLKKKDKPLVLGDKIMVARICLYADHEVRSKASFLATCDFDWNGHFHNWGKGFLKNHIQYLMTLINSGEEQQPEKIIIKDESKITKLKKQTLYAPDYILISVNKFNGDDSKKNDEKEIFESYKYPYKLVTEKELNDKILNDKEPFYYISYVQGDGMPQTINIVDSQTGEIIYFEKVRGKFNSDDMKNIVKTIEKK